ncbi:TPA: electron transport complex subunit RsxA, partial [bacterium]|nr:electron transport complex subunit RsxA [bacterium]
LVPLNIEYLQIATFILIIASLVQFSELIIKKFFPSLYKDFGIYLPLITTNCIVLGTALNNLILSNTIANFNFLHLIVYSLSIPVGYLIVIYLFSSIRVRLESAPIPKAFKGVPIALITAAFMALAFRGFSGIL